MMIGGSVAARAELEMIARRKIPVPVKNRTQLVHPVTSHITD
jgi:hypothetical protein